MTRKKQNSAIEDIDKQIEKLKEEVRSLEAKKTEIENAEYIKEHEIDVSNYLNKFILDIDTNNLFYVKNVKLQSNGILITAGTEIYIDNESDAKYDHIWKISSSTLVYYNDIKIYNKEDVIKYINDIKKERNKALDKIVGFINKI